MLFWSTATFTPFTSSIRSSGEVVSSKPIFYEKPEHPPPTTASLSTAFGLMVFCSTSCDMIVLSSAAAFSVSLIATYSGPLWGSWAALSLSSVPAPRGTRNLRPLPT